MAVVPHALASRIDLRPEKGTKESVSSTSVCLCGKPQSGHQAEDMHFASKTGAISVCLFQFPVCYGSISIYYEIFYEIVLHNKEQGQHSGEQEDQSETNYCQVIGSPDDRSLCKLSPGSHLNQREVHCFCLVISNYLFIRSFIGLSAYLLFVCCSQHTR